MRSKWKKTFAMMLALFLTVTSVGSDTLFVFAEETAENNVVVNEIAAEDTETAELPQDSTKEEVIQDTEEIEAEEIDTEEKEVVEETIEETEKEEVKVEEVEETTEEVMEEVTEETEAVPEKDTVEKQLLTYEPLEQPEGVRVTASAYEGVLPEGAYMVVSELSEGSVAYLEAEKSLEDHEISFDGFKALDITFYSAEGQVIEPEEGTVQVHMALDVQGFPENADPNTIAVQHHDTSHGEVQIETVADVTVGTVEVQEAEVVAEFGVDSFSTFTITWDGAYKDYEITVKYVDKTGKEIDCTDAKNVEVYLGTTIALNQYAYEINGYTYLGAHLSQVDGETVTHVRAGWNRRDYYFQYYGDDKKWKDLKEDTTIYLVYDGAPEEGGEIVDTKTLSREKYVTKNADDTYDLTLTVSGAVGTLTNKVKLDVLLIVDKSGSMKNAMSTEDSQKRIKAVSDAVNTLTTTLSENQNLDVKYSVVTFSGPDDWETKGSNSDASTALGWNASATDAYNKVNGISPVGGTNYQAGINKGINQLKSARASAQKIVIFFTDGMPTIRNGYVACKETDTTNVGLCNDAAVAAVGGLSANAFYCVGTGSASETNLTKIKDATKAETKAVYLVSDTTALNKAFKEIASDSATFLCDHVMVTDLLSENVDAVRNGSDLKKLEVSIKKDNRDVVTPGRSVVAPKTEQNAGNDASRTISASFDAATKQIQLKFPAEYQLEPDFTYLVTLTIDATEKAYENYREYGNAYPDRGQLGTGVTSANQLGVFTNKEAEVSYTYKGANKTESYPMPVIQLHPGKLIIEKTIRGLDETKESALFEKLKFSYKLNNGESVEIPIQSFEYHEETKNYTFQIEGLSPNTSYEVSELNAELEDFDLTQSSVGTSGTIPKDGKLTASFVNSYTASQRTLTVKKNVSGNMGSDKQAFTFRLTVTKNGQSYTGDIAGLTKENGVYSFELKHGESKTIVLPYGCDFTLSEVDDHQGYVTSYAVGRGESVNSKTVTMSDMTEDTEITFTNIKEITVPTGVIWDHTPFLMMIAVAAVGICFLLIEYGKRRQF